MSNVISIDTALNSFNKLLDNNILKLNEEFNTFNKVIDSVNCLKESNVLKEAEEEKSKKNILKRILDAIVNAVKYVINKVVSLWKKLLNKLKIDKQMSKKVADNISAIEDDLSDEQINDAMEKATPKLLEWTKLCTENLGKTINSEVNESVETASTVKNNISNDTMADISFEANISTDVGDSINNSVKSIEGLELDFFSYDVGIFEDSKVGNEIKDDFETINIYCNYTINPISKNIMLNRNFIDKLKKDMDGAIACQDAVVDNLDSLNKDGLNNLLINSNAQLKRFERDAFIEENAEACWFNKNYRMYKYRSEGYKYILQFITKYISKANKVYEQLDIIRKYYTKNILIINTYFSNAA